MSTAARGRGPRLGGPQMWPRERMVRRESPAAHGGPGSRSCRGARSGWRCAPIRGPSLRWSGGRPAGPDQTRA
eukprot:84440-Pyramimonas_sp.AAC.1